MCGRGFYVKVLQLQHVAIHVPILPFHHRLPRPPASLNPPLLDLLIFVVEGKYFPLYEERKKTSVRSIYTLLPLTRLLLIALSSSDGTFVPFVIIIVSVYSKVKEYIIL
jgi:hypothetical protein